MLKKTILIFTIFALLVGQQPASAILSKYTHLVHDDD